MPDGRAMKARARFFRRPFCRHGNTSSIKDDGFVAWKCHDCGKVSVSGPFFENHPAEAGR